MTYRKYLPKTFYKDLTGVYDENSIRNDHVLIIKTKICRTDKITVKGYMYLKAAKPTTVFGFEFQTMNAVRLEIDNELANMFDQISTRYRPRFLTFTCGLQNDVVVITAFQMSSTINPLNTISGIIGKYGLKKVCTSNLLSKEDLSAIKDFIINTSEIEILIIDICNSDPTFSKIIQEIIEKSHLRKIKIKGPNQYFDELIPALHHNEYLQVLSADVWCRGNFEKIIQNLLRTNHTLVEFEVQFYEKENIRTLNLNDLLQSNQELLVRQNLHFTEDNRPEIYCSESLFAP